MLKNIHTTKNMGVSISPDRLAPCVYEYMSYIMDPMDVKAMYRSRIKICLCNVFEYCRMQTTPYIRQSHLKSQYAVLHDVLNN